MNSIRLLGPRCFAARQKAASAVLSCSVSAVGEDSIYPDALDPHCRLHRIGVGGLVLDAFRVEEHEVGVIAAADQTALRKAESMRRHSGHLMYCLREREQFFFPAIMAKHSRKRSPEAGM